MHGKNGIAGEILECLISKSPEEVTREEIMKILSRNGVNCAVGTFYNNISELMGKNLVVSRRSSIAFYRYNPSQHEIAPMGDTSCLVGEGGFVNCVMEVARANGFEEVCRVHDIHLSAPFWSIGVFRERVSKSANVWYGVSCFRWRRNKEAKSWTLKLFVGYDYKVTFQVLECGTLSAVVKCVKKPFPARLEGLRAFERVLDEACLIVFGRRRFWPFPKLDKWVVTFWHYGKDSKTSFDCRFDVLFRDFFNGLARIYVREKDGHLRIENFQNPNKALGVLKSEAEKIQAEWAALEEEKRRLQEKKEDEIRRLVSSPLVASMVASMVASTVNELADKFIEFGNMAGKSVTAGILADNGKEKLENGCSNE